MLLLIALPAMLAATAQQTPPASPVVPPTAPVVTPTPVAPPPPSTAASNASPQPQESDPASADVVVVARKHIAGDPFERVNAKTFAVTQSVDRAVVAPIAKAYRHGLPRPVRSGLRNLLSNLDEPIIFANYLIQLKPGKAAETFGRFAINSTIGGAGLFDVARSKPFHLPYRPNGFADTLGYYGVRPGAFFYFPVLGPTTVRDLIGFVADSLVLPVTVGKPFNRLWYTVPTASLSALDHRDVFDAQLAELHRGPDPYAKTRDFYLRSRQAEIDALHGKPSPIPLGSKPLY